MGRKGGAPAGIGLGWIATGDYTTLYWAPMLLKGRPRREHKVLMHVVTANGNTASFYSCRELSWWVLLELYLCPAFLQRCCKKRQSVMQFAFRQLRLVVERLALAQANPHRALRVHNDVILADPTFRGALILRQQNLLQHANRILRNSSTYENNTWTHLLL